MGHAARLKLLLMLVLFLASCTKSEITASPTTQHIPISDLTTSSDQSQSGSAPNPKVSASNRLLPGSGNYIKFKRISVDQGLSQSTVYTILEDRYGFIWMGTWDGFNRYDGYSFKGLGFK